MVSLRKAMKYALMDHATKDRCVWVLRHASQVKVDISKILFRKLIDFETLPF